MRTYRIRDHIFQGPGKNTQPPPSAQCLQARQLQHTADMLEGVLYVDRLAPGAVRNCPFLGSKTAEPAENITKITGFRAFSCLFPLDMGDMGLLWVHPH